MKNWMAFRGVKELYPGMAGLQDRSSHLHGSPRGTSQEKIIDIEQLRRQRWTGVRIAQHLHRSRAT